jgi:hypothetical protein
MFTVAVILNSLLLIILSLLNVGCLRRQSEMQGKIRMKNGILAKNTLHMKCFKP